MSTGLEIYVSTLKPFGAPFLCIHKSEKFLNSTSITRRNDDPFSIGSFGIDNINNVILFSFYMVTKSALTDSLKHSLK